MAKTTKAVSCAPHYFVVESPGPGKNVLLGTCRYCETTKSYPAVLEERDSMAAGRRVTLRLSAAWKAEATAMIHAGQDTATIAEAVGKSTGTISKLRRRDNERREA